MIVEVTVRGQEGDVVSEHEPWALVVNIVNYISRTYNATMGSTTTSGDYEDNSYEIECEFEVPAEVVGDDTVPLSWREEEKRGRKTNA